MSFQMRVMLLAFPFGLVFHATATEQLAFTVDEPETVLTFERQKALGIAFIDSGLPMLIRSGQPKWFFTRHDHAHNDEGQVLLHGPREDPFAEIVRKNIRIEGTPELRVEFKRPGAACWVGNMYYDKTFDQILAFLHLEYWPHRMPRQKYNRMGLAVSQDGGDTFHWCGFIITPDLSYERWLNHEFKGGLPSNNVGWISYIVKDGWFYAYYRDTKDNVEQPSSGMACARAPVNEVVRAARDHQVTPWKKYHEGAFTEDGLGGAFTPLLNDRGLMHGDAAYNTHLERYILVVRDGKHTETTGALLITSSQDGINWAPWQDIQRNEHLHDYPVIISTGDDNEVTGQSFWIYYKYDPDDRMPKKYGRMRLDRVLVTLK